MGVTNGDELVKIRSTTEYQRGSIIHMAVHQGPSDGLGD